MAAKKINLAIFISGRGSNMQALIEACRVDDFPARVALVVSNRPDAGGLAVAEAAGIETTVVDHKKFPDRASFESMLLEVLADKNIDLICLAGFMRVLGAGFIDAVGIPIINIHPSLLPAYRGLHIHERVLADGVPETGCTVHYVTPGVDEGPAIIQKKIPVQPGDTPETLAARVLAQEHVVYAQAIRLLAPQLKLTQK